MPAILTPTSPGGGGEFDGVHNDLPGRAAAGAHPAGSITGLGAAALLDPAEVVTDEDAQAALSGAFATHQDLDEAAIGEYTPEQLIEAATSPEAVAVLSETFPRGLTAEDHSVVVLGHPENTIDGGTSNTVVGGGQAGSPNRIVGTAALRTIVGGYDNEIGANIASGIVASQHSVISGDATHALIAGGSALEITTGDYGAAVGGTNNTVEAGYAATIAGVNNSATAPQAVVLGGQGHTASGQGSAIAGGSGATAAGSAAAILGGTNPAAHGASSGIVGGNGATIGSNGTTFGDYCGIVGGFSNVAGTTATARFSGIVAGRSISIQEEYGAAVGGQDNSVLDGASHAVVTGRSAVARMVGQHAHGGHQFSAPGDAQSSVVVVRAQTTDATPTLLTCNGAASAPATRLTVPSDSAWAFSALIVARRTDADSESAGWRIEGVAHNNAGTLTLIGTPSIMVLGASDDADWDVAVSVGTGTSIAITVTGESGKTIHWVGRVETAEVTG